MDVASTVWAWRNPPDPDQVEAERTRAHRREGSVQALVGACLGALIFSLPWWWTGAAAWFPRVVSYVAWSVSAVVLTAAWLSPNGAYAAIQRVVYAVAHAVGVTLTFLLMTPIFLLFFVPFRALCRRGRRDRLLRTFPDPATRTFWIERTEHPTPEAYQRQF